MEVREMEILTKSITEIKPYDKNPRKNDASVDKVAESIKQFGFKVPLVIDKNNIIVTGHTRYKAAKKLGLKEVPCIMADDLTDEQIKAYRLADNKVGEFSEWDFGLLEEELDEIFDIDMSDFGFADVMEDEEPVEVQEDDFDGELPEEPNAKPGDIYQLGRHRLMCGDSTSITDIEKLMNGAKADLVFTDPPYGMKKEKDGVANDNLNYDDLLDFNRQWIPLSFVALKDNGSWYCWGIDEPLMDIYSNILKPMAKENKITFRNLITWDKGNGQGQLAEEFRMYATADEKCLFVMCGTSGFSEKEENAIWAKPIADRIKQMLDEKKLTIKEAKNIIGHSENSPNHFTDYKLFRFPKKEYFDKWGIEKKQYEELKKQYEELKRNFYDSRSYFNNTHDNMNNVWHFDRAGKDERVGHATPKPIALCSRAIKSSSREEEAVLDLFGGSGSTLIACEQLNRSAYLMELEPKWVDVIIARWEAFTGKKAVLLNE